MHSAKSALPSLVIALLLQGCALFGDDQFKPETAIESQAAVEILFAETVKTAIIYRANQIEAGDNRALVGVDAGLITLIADDRISSTLAPIREAGRSMTLAELDRLIDERDQLLAEYRDAGIGTSKTAQVDEFFADLESILHASRLALGAGDLLAAESFRGQALEALRTLRAILAE